MAKTHAPSAADASPPAARPSRLARVLGLLPARLRNWKVASGLALVLAMAIIGTSVAATLFLGGAKSPDRKILLTKALTRLDAGNFAEARQVATELRGLPDASFAERGAAMFVLGSVLAREAQEHPDEAQQRILNLVASRYLDQARIHGFPEGREAEGLLSLARASARSGRYAQSLPILREALAANPHAAAELQRSLAECHLQLAPPKLAEALRHAAKYLAIEDLSPAEQQAGLLLQSRILLAQGDTAAATAVLARIPERSRLAADAIMLGAQVTIEAARQARQLSPDLPEPLRQSLTATIAALRGLEGKKAIDRELIPRVQLLIGHAYETLGDRRAAIGQFDRLRRTRFGRPDGMAATFYLADLVREEGRADEAVEHYKRALQQAGPRDAYQNAWLSLAEIESRLKTATSDLTARGNFAATIELTQAMVSLAPEVLALQQQIAARGGWAGQLLAQAVAQPSAAAEVTRAESRQQLRQAGADGERLAALRVATRHYIDDLAAAAESYQRGQGYRQAVRVWREFLRQNPPQKRPEAMVGLGESLLALGEVDEALKTLAQCREDFAAHPATYRARLLENYACQEKGDLSRAKELLLDNLYRHALTPQSSDWRDSIYALGHLLYLQACAEETSSRLAGVDRVDADAVKEGLKSLEQSHATFEEAIRTLTEAVQRYPTAEQSVEARYWIAESYRHSALWPRKKLAVTNIETSRLALNRQIQQELNAALEEYRKLLAELSDEQQLPRRTPVELAMLRNCYFGRADALFDLARYDEAIQAYSAATNRYQHDPESLEAYVQIATCYRRLKRPNEARGTLEQARVVLQRIRPDAPFLGTTRLDRQAWDNLLSWLRTL